ncbi:protein YIPF1 [Glossina fuscipes]|uniref:Protein YIPF n=1 Tax=Glossina fuscipes TaxID=7396 RepID=A0A9C6DYF0_9MUSC|nr:protein YIPF1 [Glossina fuscipes]
MQNDDLLQFKDFTNTSSAAQISVNSPTHGINIGASGGRQRGDPLSELIYDMSSSAQMLASSDNNMGGVGIDGVGGGRGGGGGGGNSGGADINNLNIGGNASTNDSNTKASFLALEYYEQFFNVDTYMVLERIANSMIPKRAPGNYLRYTIGSNPDLYGPFWITVTLIFSIAISGNIASFLQHGQDNYQWRYNFHLVSYAATCIFIYANFIPAALWTLFKYSLKPLQEGLETENADYTPSLLSLMCIYGYSLSIYIPVSILWVIQISFLQWLLVISAALLSGSVLIGVLTPALRNSKLSLFLVFGILSAHFLLAAGFMLYFFHVPNSTGNNNDGGATSSLSLVSSPSLPHAVKSVAEANVTPALGSLGN